MVDDICTKQEFLHIVLSFLSPFFSYNWYRKNSVKKSIECDTLLMNFFWIFISITFQLENKDVHNWKTEKKFF